MGPAYHVTKYSGSQGPKERDRRGMGSGDPAHRDTGASDPAHGATDHPTSLGNNRPNDLMADRTTELGPTARMI